MLDPKDFYEELIARGIEFFTGVPDSLLKSLCAYIDDKTATRSHVITANEGNAIGLASGYHLATNKAACVYMQNSGLGNAVNPLASLADSQVYSIPMLLIIGWRGEPGVKDEPQHVKQGAVTEKQLQTLGIPYEIVDANSDYTVLISRCIAIMKEINAPVALLIRNNIFLKYTSKTSFQGLSGMKRESALKAILQHTKPETLVVATTGKTSREIFELRQKLGQSQRDFLSVGAMGHASSIALGVALFKPTRQVVCLDGDGSLLMHMGSMAILGSLKPKNLIHVVLNNGAHESVGGQPTVANAISIQSIALACGYAHYLSAADQGELETQWQNLQALEGPILFEVYVSVGSRPDLTRPSSSPIENKQAFVEHSRDQ